MPLAWGACWARLEVERVALNALMHDRSRFKRLEGTVLHVGERPEPSGAKPDPRAETPAVHSRRQRQPDAGTPSKRRFGLAEIPRSWQSMRRHERSDMKSTRIRPNHRFAEFRETIAAHPEWLVRWSGTFFRFQTINHPTARDVLSGGGAEARGGRWNPPGLAAVYGSTTDTTALEECNANDRYYGIETKGPRLLVAIEAELAGVLDLTSAGVRRALGVTLEGLAGEDWRKLMDAGRECVSQALGRAGASAGASGLLVRSAAVSKGVNVVVFPRAHQGDRMSVVEGDKLARLGVRLEV